MPWELSLQQSLPRCAASQAVVHASVLLLHKDCPIKTELPRRLVADLPLRGALQGQSMKQRLQKVSFYSGGAGIVTKAQLTVGADGAR